MLFTKIWSVTLALLATSFLAGMFLLSLANSGGFTDGDRKALRAVTEAGVAALAADLQSSAVAIAPSLLQNSRLKTALELPVGEIPTEDGLDLEGEFQQVANESLLRDHPLMSVALIDKSGAIVARTGLAEQLFDELTKLAAFTTMTGSNEDSLFSATLGGKLHSVKISRPEQSSQARRLVALQAIDLGGGSFLRRVLGTSNPAGLVRDGQLLGEPIGGANAAELVALVTASLESVPPEGASEVSEIGEGANRRIGAVGRVPGPAGKGKDGTFFAVLSQNTVGATQKDLAQHLAVARSEGVFARLNWVLLAGVLFLSLALSLYLPHVEAAAPLRRLHGEFEAISQGRQHQIFHDTYTGLIGQVARASAAAQEAQRTAWQSELMTSGEDFPEAIPEPSRTTRNTRTAARGTKRTKPVQASTEPEAIDLPEAPEDATLELHSHAAAKPAPAPAPRPAPKPAPSLSDAVVPEDEDGISVGDINLGTTAMPTIPPPPIPSSAPVRPPPAGAPVSADPRDEYYRTIFDEFVEIKRACGEPLEGFTFDKFAKKLRKNTEDLMARPGTADVEFSVYVKDGKAALKAKVIKT